MQPFLDKLAEDILKKYGEATGKICVVFPSRRAGLFFKKYLSEKISKPVWPPKIFGIKDFISELSPYSIEDNLLLVFELYEVYRKYVSEDSFDKFYPWGDMMLSDFDDIDKNLVPAGELFRIIKEHKELEEDFEMNFGDYEEFEKFWSTFSSKELSGSQKEFIKTWEILGKVYEDFRSRLQKKNIAYEGMAYRKLCDDLKSGTMPIKWDKVIFAGFNALNNAELTIIRELTKRNAFEAYWDADEYYINNGIQEAGQFLRQNFRDLNPENPNWVENNFAEPEKKNIRIIGSSMQTGEVKALSSELGKLIKTKGSISENTAIVLPDESMLLPLLYSIPPEIESLNITMGYPFNYSPLFSFIELIKNLQLNKKPNKNNPVFYHKDVIGLLLHPYVKVLSDENSGKVLKQITDGNMIYVSANFMNRSAAEAFTELFRAVDGVNDSIEYIKNLLSLISAETGTNESKNSFEQEFFFELAAQLNRISEISSQYSTELTAETFWRLIAEVLRTIKIPFSGEPLSGLQIMGLLETRSLDFENVFILSMNEGIMPRSGASGSFIPFSLRKSFRLPTFEDDDATSAYYFYRLLQKAKNIYLFYNTEPGELSGGEKSRFIMQIENELGKINSNIEIENFLVQLSTPKTARKAITISKSKGIIEGIKNGRPLSATSFTSYITCKLKFYLERAAKLKEEEDIEEFFGGATFGNIFHALMEILYQDYKGKTLSEKDIARIKKQLEEKFEEILSLAFKKLSEERIYTEELEGKNLLYKGIIKKLAVKILENDMNDAPLKIRDLEADFTSELKIKINNKPEKINLLGRIDRIDESKSTIRIIDYKTGKPKHDTITEKSYELMFSNPDYKEQFQTHFYAMLYLKQNPKHAVLPGIYPLRNISDGIRYVTKEAVTSDSIKIFESEVIKLTEEMLNSAIPFSQTEDEERCKFCAYKGLCYRK